MSAAEQPRLRPPQMRSILFLEALGEMIQPTSFPYPEVRLQVRRQGGGNEFAMTLFATGSFEALFSIAQREIDLAVVNPSGALTMAYRGKGPFAEPVPVRIVAVMPSADEFAFAVAAGTGIRSLADLAARRYPLRISMRAQRDHAVHWYVEEAFKAHGFTLAELMGWGGSVSYDPGLPFDPARLARVEDGHADAIFDEAVRQWVGPAVEMGMHFLPIEGPAAERLADAGLRPAALTRERFPMLPADVTTLDFSGWPIYTHADVDEELIYRFCHGMDSRRARIPWDGPGELPVATMCRDTPATPMDVPLHPGAERYWREAGYLE